jgi:hypothetical protein
MIIMFMSSDRIVSGQTTVTLLATAENIFLAPPKCIGAFVILVTRKVNKCVYLVNQGQLKFWLLTSYWPLSQVLQMI